MNLSQVGLYHPPRDAAGGGWAVGGGMPCWARGPGPTGHSAQGGGEMDFWVSVYQRGGQREGRA